MWKFIHQIQHPFNLLVEKKNRYMKLHLFEKNCTYLKYLWKLYIKKNLKNMYKFFP